MLICWVHLYGHSITGVWELDTPCVSEEEAKEVWKLLLTHCPSFRPGGWDIPLLGHEG